MTHATDDDRLFAQHAPMLTGLAYRILGSRADAEDAVQDTYLKWLDAERAAIDNPAAWLTTACTRRCIDLLRAAHRTRVDYVGSWLPEPIQAELAHASAGSEPEAHWTLASSLSTAFLLLLERLTPKERAAYLLHEIFDQPYAEVAKILEIEEAACRKLVQRARGNVEQAKVRHVTPAEQQDQLLAAFETAIVQGRTAPLAALLSQQVALHADGGGKATAAAQAIHGADAVLGFIASVLHPACREDRWTFVDLNGSRGVILERQGRIEAAISFGYDEGGALSDIFIMRNPDKLARLEAVRIQ
ncbi:RNA polymerase sigma factor SigJ [Lysobacter enzymogenes]|uniref:RNA polymerase sigma factor SigJ n=1 Tax=Lysobacter enzymogenes TaxID=69 RepID=UPI001A95A5EA|nr:RNA polymerase sigma factor SigJ [Lysobacter enzymogenes]QQP94803.1 RNA polymerase sigma factor SigJ [Lysobacter enzymogenes]